MNKIDFILIFDTLDANPNGDPDAGNMPRIDPETGHGIVTDVCLKRKIRNYVQMTQNDTKRFDIYVKERAIFNELHQQAHEATGFVLTGERKVSDVQQSQDGARKWMCDKYFDIRTFGAVMTTGVNCGQVRGPVQLSFSRSVDSVTQLEYAITRCAVTDAKDAQKERTMGRKYTVPYALYMAKGTVNPFLAVQSGFDETDLVLLKKALVHMFDFDASAARPAGSMVMRRVLFFVHDSELGSAPAHKLYECVKVSKREGVEVPRCYTDYDVQIAPLPAGVKLEDLTE